MKEIFVYKTRDLVLKVGSTYDPMKLPLSHWEEFLDTLCGNREYQKEAIRAALIYIASGKYTNINDLIRENWEENPELKGRYKTLDEYAANIQLPNKLSANIDLATGTGKSYVMYGIAQICLGLGLVDKVLVLCPSLTIEDGLKEKFNNLSGDNRIKATIPEDTVWKNPRIVDANQTIKNGDLAVENIHAVYERTGSSIKDSLGENGSRVLVLNDESHHIYNSSSDKDVKKWREFLLSEDYGFNYMLGLTGTAYVDDLYFNDVIYRYSIRQAIDDQVVKSVEYVSKDESIDQDVKFQKIYDNHLEAKNTYRKIKPISILVTKDISTAKNLEKDLKDFICKRESIDSSDAAKKVLIVTSSSEHKKNLIKLKTVDDISNPAEWIVSVSMLTEGWDVKNVFQIVPMEDRAFNSKLLISQVLGRGLRIPDEYQTPQPKVRIFNHDAWSKNIRGLVDEILEIELRLSSVALQAQERAKYHFDIYNVNYAKQEKMIQKSEKTPSFDYSKSTINLVSQAESITSETEYEDFKGIIKTKNTEIQKRVYSVDDVIDKIMDAFETREFEAKIRFPGGTYTKENLPPRKEIKTIIDKSMKNAGILSGLLTEDNAQRTFQTFQTLFRKRANTAAFERVSSTPQVISTSGMEKESMAVGLIRRGATVFYSEDYKTVCDHEQTDILNQVIEDESLPRSSSKEVNRYLFKTPVNIVLTNQEPERKFVRLMTEESVANKIDSWIKSRDRNFYSIEYTWRKGEHHTQAHFNPDFIIKIGDSVVIVEIKSDNDVSPENIAKRTWAIRHFESLNQLLKKKKINQKYYFNFLSPESYPEFKQYLIDGRLTQGKFYSSLDRKLETK